MLFEISFIKQKNKFHCCFMGTYFPMKLFHIFVTAVLAYFIIIKYKYGK